MTVLRRQVLVLLAASASGLLARQRSAEAQSFPTRQITMVAPFPPGGAIDILGRLVAERMQESLGQPVIIENVSGAAGSLGPGRVVRAASDGYTLSLGTSGTHVLNGATMTLQYDVLNDFEPIALLSNQPLVIVTRKDMPASDLKELVTWLKSNPDKATQGMVGSTSQLVGVLFQKMTDTRLVFAPYRGTNLALQDMVAGRIDMMFDLASLCMPFVRAGTVKAYAVLAKNRLTAAPEIPTVDEAGLPGFHSSLWIALWAPKGTPKEVVTKLNTAVVDAFSNSAVRTKLADLGHELFPRDQQTPEALATLQKSEIDKWWPIIKAAGIKAN